MTTTRKISQVERPSQAEIDDVFLSEQEEALSAREVERKLFAAIDKGELLKVDDLLKELSTNRSTLDFRDDDGLNTYSHAINEGFAPVIEILLSYNVPLGDALLRACAVSFEEAVKIIIKQARKLAEKERRSIIECRCDNDEFPLAMTPLKMAAIRNNFVIVQLLLKAGAERIQEPKLEGLADATLSVVVEYLDTYRALSSPAYLGLAHSNALGNAFKLTGRLRKIAASWEAVNKEFYDLADQVEKFAASLLDHIANSYELGTLFRQSDNPEVVHAVSQVQTAVEFDQKAFVAHAYTQTIMSINFYRNLDVHSKMFSFLSLLSIFGYPFICLAYLLVQHPRLKAFISIPHIKLCMFFGSDLAFLAVYAAACFITDRRALGILTLLIVIFCVALCWKHIREIMKYGIRDFLRNSMNILEFIITTLSFTLAMCGLINVLGDYYVTRAKQRYNERVAMVRNIIVTSEPSNVTEFERLEELISLDWNDPQIVSFTMFGVVVLFNVLRAFNTVLNSYHDLYAIWESTVGAVRDIFTFLVIYVIVLLAFALGLYNLYVPEARLHEAECQGMMECEIPHGDYRTVPISMLTLWWEFNGLGNAATVGNEIHLVNVLHVVIVAIYYIVALVLVNTLIAMLGSRFTAVEENSDTEWKFGRTKMWLRLIRSDIVIPPPFNLLPTTGFLIQLVKHCCCFCTGCTKTQEQQSKKPEGKPIQDGNPRKVLRDILERYRTTKIEKTDEEDSVGIDDLRQLKQDFVNVKYNVQTNLQIIQDMIDATWATIRNIEYSLPTIDFVSLQIPETTLAVTDTFKFNYTFIDDDVESIQQAIHDVMEVVTYRPDVVPKPSPKVIEEPVTAVFEVPQESSTPVNLEPDPVPEKPSPKKVIEEPIIPLPEVPQESSPPVNLEPDPVPEKLDTVSNVTGGASLTRKMAQMFEAGRTVDVDREVTEEIVKYRRRFSSSDCYESMLP